MLSDLVGWLTSLANWWAYFGAVLIVSDFFGWLVPWWKKWPFFRHIMAIIGIALLFYSSYKAWDNEHAQLQNLHSISGRVDEAIIGKEPGGSHVAFIVTVTNGGSTVGIDPGTWRATAVMPNGTAIIGQPREISAPKARLCLSPHSYQVFVPADALYSKAANGVPGGLTLQGVLWFSFRSVRASDLKSQGTVFRLNAVSVYGQTISISDSVSDLMSHSGQQTLFSGLAYPVVLHGSCS